MRWFKEREGHIIKLQAHFRMYLTRRAYLEQNGSKPQNSCRDERRNNSKLLAIKKKGYKIRELKAMPDYSNEQTRQAEERFGKFEFDDEDPSGLEVKGPIELNEEAVYLGQWSKQGLREGRGTQIWSDGSKYEGYWKDDAANGRGRLIHSNGDCFTGEWKNDKAHGQGQYEHLEGAHYTGSWREDCQHGTGVEIYPDGSKYEGSHAYGKKHGNGTYIWADQRKYEGEWKASKMHGKGTFTWPDGRKFVGEYSEDKKKGYGEFFWPDGRIY
mmetsp:Transcript_39504/g.60303  ORF Transcript_39504/g.60303 Transcript_39504/m.60303 type:complete len:270 (+) Transcript_39504:88-897(+)|eukprot:CAMPEP_0170505848 /NCGR_PEP_ID=MMETSP0208-20121228/52454_1 /TAXON_ID=197538 /ORGANISM="Strombidium inclinatum, Strain S3" /LENGTH=269 /DNA_ID=CAMNT_0010786983 /DNA_START=37 /DNA_END=846 /DNA_ORIENTATION=+